MEHHYKELLRQWENDEHNIKEELKEIGFNIKNITKRLDGLVVSTLTPARETFYEGNNKRS